MAYYDEWDDDLDVSFGCDPECGFETKSAAAMKRHEAKCWWCQTPADVIEAARVARAEQESAAFMEHLRAEDANTANGPCCCDADFAYLCDPCRARGFREPAR